MDENGRMIDDSTRTYRNLYLYRRRLACLLNLCRQDGGDTVPPKAVNFSIPPHPPSGVQVLRTLSRGRLSHITLYDNDKTTEEIEVGSN